MKKQVTAKAKKSMPTASHYVELLVNEILSAVLESEDGDHRVACLGYSLRLTAEVVAKVVSAAAALRKEEIPQEVFIDGILALFKASIIEMSLPLERQRAKSLKKEK